MKKSGTAETLYDLRFRLFETTKRRKRFFVGAAIIYFLNLKGVFQK